LEKLIGLIGFGPFSEAGAESAGDLETGESIGLAVRETGGTLHIGTGSEISITFSDSTVSTFSISISSFVSLFSLKLKKS